MQLCSAIVRHAGNLGMTIHKEGLPPAEIVLLRAIHGEDAVVNIAVTHEQARRENRAEVERLKTTYGEKVFVACFPGRFPQLPTTLADIAVDEDDGEPGESDDEMDGPAVQPPSAALDRARAARGARASQAPAPAGDALV